MSATYINPALPGMIRNLYRDELRPKSIQNMLDLAADLVQELIDLRANQGKPQITVTEGDLIERAKAHARRASRVRAFETRDIVCELVEALENVQITEQMVEDGARALAEWDGADWDAEVWDWSIPREAYRHGARRCLEAALGKGGE